MKTGVAIALGALGGFALALLLANGSGCCAALGRAGLAKYGAPDLGTGVDSVLGGLISTLGLA